MSSALERFADMNVPCPCKLRMMPKAPTREEWMQGLRNVIIEMLDEVDDATEARRMSVTPAGTMRIIREHRAAYGMEPHG